MKWISNKTLFNVHGWLGLNFGLLLFVICFSGTFATLSSEVDWLLNSDMRIEKSDKPVQWEAMFASLTETFPDGTILGIYKSDYAVSNDRFATVAFVGLPNGQNRKVYLNPYTGKIQGHTSFFNVQRFFRTYHRRFFDGERGILLITFTSFFLLFSVITGFLFYKGWLKNLFRLRLKNGIRALWSDVHKLTGIWSLLFALLIALTGVFYLTEVVLQANGYGEILVPDEPAKIQPESLSVWGPKPALLPLDVYVDNARKAFPELDVQSVRVPHQSTDYVYVDGQTANPIVRDRANKVYLHPFSGEVVHIQKSENLNVAEFITDIADPLHFGYFGGLTTKILWFIFGLGISFAILSGTYLWYVRSMEKMERRLRRSENSSGKKAIGQTNAPRIFAGSIVRPFTVSRGAVCSTVLMLLYLVTTGIGAVKEGIRSFGPLPEDWFANIRQVRLGPWKADFMCEYPCSFQEGRFFLKFNEAGIPNYASAYMELVTAGGETIKVPFKGSARRPSLADSKQIDESVIRSIKLKAESRDGQVFAEDITLANIERGRELLLTRFDRYPEKTYPDVPLGVYAYIAFFALCTITVLGFWTYFLIRATSKRFKVPDSPS